MQTLRKLTLPAAAVLGLAGTQATAQAVDPSGRYDIDEAMHRHGHEVSELPDRDAARPVSFDLMLGGTYSTNAEASRFGGIDTGYVTPGLAVDVRPVSLAGWDVGAGAQIDADYYAGDYDARLGEGRAEGFVFAERGVGPGTLTAEVILFGAFANDFSDQQFRLTISALNYNVTRGGLSGDLAAEYEDSDVPELRRTRVSGTLGYSLPEPQLGYDLTIEGDVAFSDFNGGGNQGRQDTTAALVLIAGRDLTRALSLEWDAAVVRRFSNREASRFTALELGVQLDWRF